jgi:hypothetical protein
MIGTTEYQDLVRNQKTAEVLDTERFLKEAQEFPTVLIERLRRMNPDRRMSPHELADFVSDVLERFKRKEL